MTLRAITDKAFYEISVFNGSYRIVDSNVSYLREVILGKNCSMPKAEMPLTIYISANDWVETNRVRRIEVR